MVGGVHGRGSTPSAELGPALQKLLQVHIGTNLPSLSWPQGAHMAAPGLLGLCRCLAGRHGW